MDTGAWIALVNRDDGLHQAARKHYERLVADRVALFTTNYVVDESVTRLRYDLGIELALEFRDVVRASERDRRLRIVWVDRRIEGLAWDILERYADVPLSMTDAATIAIARSHRIRELFAFDDDFRAVGLTVAPN